ncbi:ribosomal RNA-processing protein 7-domain-containing protein, partial [Hygrophoropsis aurantiaca]
TLFLVNVPPDATEREIALFFKYCGTVERVVFDQDDVGPNTEVDSDADDGESSVGEENIYMDTDGNAGAEQSKPRKRRKVSKDTTEPTAPTLVPFPSPSLRTLRKTGLCIHLVFLDASALQRALSPPLKSRPWPSSEEPRGLAHYAALYDSLRPPLDIVKAHADSAMEVFEYELAKGKQKAEYRKGEAIVDEDGFTLVTRGGAYGKNLGGGVGVASKKFHQTGKTNSKKKKHAKEKDAFYAFQKAEKQRKVIMDLKKGFESDKARIEKMKEARRFKPY